jgi:hypothetical protein
VSRADFRDFLHPSDHPRVADLPGATASEHARRRGSDPLVRERLLAPWATAIEEPLRGITTDGQPIRGLFRLQANGAPAQAMAEAAARLLAAVTTEQRARLCRPLDAREWRMWNNTEIYFFENGLRLDEVGDDVRAAILGLMRATLSAEGFELTRHTMWLNGFLGELVCGPEVLGEYSYNMTLFGRPSTSEPWGWQLQGHHIALNMVVIGEQLLGTPVFLGAEPNYAEHGPYSGRVAFEDHERLGLELMRSLPPGLRSRAVVYEQMVDPAMPAGRWHPADQRHLGGAFQDNRIVPYEGARVSDFGRSHRQRLLELVDAYLVSLPSGPRAAKLDEVERHLDDTHWCWIGRHDDVHPFYYRIQSPVIMIEFDHHSGVFLANEQPEKFHVHTIVRTPNGGDYGVDLLRLHYEHDHDHTEVAPHA